MHGWLGHTSSHPCPGHSSLAFLSPYLLPGFLLPNGPSFCFVFEVVNFKFLQLKKNIELCLVIQLLCLWESAQPCLQRREGRKHWGDGRETETWAASMSQVSSLCSLFLLFYFRLDLQREPCCLTCRSIQLVNSFGNRSDPFKVRQAIQWNPLGDVCF